MSFYLALMFKSKKKVVFCKATNNKNQKKNPENSLGNKKVKYKKRIQGGKKAENGMP